jgi:hypothetical protein
MSFGGVDGAHGGPVVLVGDAGKFGAFRRARNLDLAQTSIALPMSPGFPPSQASHLVGIGDYATPWDKERRPALGGWKLVVLFLVGYGLPLGEGMRPARFLEE